jgi:hypothetical protein
VLADPVALAGGDTQGKILSSMRFLDQTVFQKKLRIFSEPIDPACLADRFLS